MLWTMSKAFLCKGQNPDHRRSCALDFADASVAQLVAQRIRNAWVAGSSPAGSLENTGVLRGKKVRKHQGLRTFSFFLGKSYIMAT